MELSLGKLFKIRWRRAEKIWRQREFLNNWTHKTITMTITTNKQTHPEIKSKIHVTSGRGLCAESYPYDLN